MNARLLSAVVMILAVSGCTRAESSTNRTSADTSSSAPDQEVTPAEVDRVPVEEARQRVQAGEALLVIAYEGEERFRQAALEGAISFDELQSRRPSLSPDQEVIFYCG